MIVRQAPAKLNLFLHITGRRPDGYHLLESLFAFTASGDEISVTPASEFSLEIDGPFAPELAGGPADENLVLQAAKLLAAEEEVGAAASIRLTKNLPVAAGIGGGSADAAATLLALVDLWGLSSKNLDLHALALKLGADVPACLHASPMFVKGIGEQLQGAALKESYFVLLVNPGLHVPTPQIFREFQQQGSSFSDSGIQMEEPVSVDWLDIQTNNALTPAASRLCPEIDAVLNALEACTGARLVRMSGSGATCFALFETEAEASTAEAEIAAGYPNWWVKQDQLIAG